MITSFKFKIIALIVVVLACTSAVIMYFTQRDVARAMSMSEERSALNVLELAELNIKAGYDRLISEKIELLGHYKDEMNHTARFGSAILREYVNLEQTSALDRRQAQQAALQWLNSVGYNQGDIFVFDNQGRIISHPDERLEGFSLAGLRDLKGRRLDLYMREDALPVLGDDGVFFWRKPGETEGHKYMGHFLPIRGWGWTLAVTIDFGDIERQSRRKLAAITQALHGTFTDITVAQNGYAFLFSGENELLIPPRSMAAKEQPTAVQHEVLNTLQRAFERGDKRVGFRDPFLPDSPRVEAFISYFKAFDWYLAVVVPVNEINAPGNTLVARQSLLIGIIFLFSLIPTLILVSRIARPLNILSAHAKALPNTDFNKQDLVSPEIESLAKHYQDEIGQLAESFIFMESAIREHIRQAREDKHAAEQASKAKSEFLATMSHEIRTPMNGVLGMTEIMQDSGLSAEQRRHLDMIRTSGETLLAIINDILDLSKIEAGKLQLEQRPFNLPALIEEQCALFLPRAQAKGLALTYVTPPHLLNGNYLGDVVRLRQILSNLLANAIKFTPQGKVKIILTVVNETIDKSDVRISVQDTGIGISPAHQRRIFESFAQADNSTTRRFGGTGLGLAISRQLTQMMGGTIELSSELDKGSTFWVELQLPKATAAQIEAAQQRPEDQRTYLETPLQGTVLLTEDNKVNQEYAYHILSALGLETDIANNGKEALEKYRQHPYDLILMDCQMPEMDGYQAVAAIRQLEAAEPQRGHVPVVALTANALEGDRYKCFAAGMDDYLAKPFSKQDVYQLLRPWLPTQDSADSDDTATEHTHQAATEALSETEQPQSETTTATPTMTTATTATTPAQRTAGEPDAGASPEADPAIDPQALSRLQSMDTDGRFLLRLINAYLEKGATDLQQLTRAQTEQNAEAVRFAAHSFKSSSYNVGAIKLAELCKRTEQQGRCGELSEIAPLVSAIEQEYSRVEAALKDLRAAHEKPHA